MRFRIVCIASILLGLILIAQADKKACNPKGSIAAQINWAGHVTCNE